jgi:hypothetical protein
MPQMAVTISGGTPNRALTCSISGTRARDCRP